MAWFVAMRRWFFFLWCPLLLALAPLPVRALDPEQPVRSMQIERWYSDEGLPHNTVHSVAQTRDGYLWLATWGGLTRYNGRSFRTFDSSDFDARIEGGFRAVLADDDGALWAASAHNGLFVWRAGRWSHLGREQGLAGENLHSLGKGMGGVWVGSRDAGAMFVSSSGEVSRYGVEQGLHSPWVHGFLAESDGGVWIATAGGLNRMQGERIVDGGAGLPPGVAVYCLQRDRTGRLWVGTSRGLYHFDGSGMRRYPLPADSLRSVSALLEDRDGSLWAGSQSEGLWRISGGQGERLTAAQGLSNNRVTSLLEDREGSLWVATSAGLNRIADSPFVTYSRFDGLRDDFVRSISEGRSGMWIGTSLGLHLLDRNGLTMVAEDALSSASVMAVLEGRDDRLWVGTYDAGLNVREAGRWRVLGREQGLPSSQIRALYEAADGAIWVGTVGGVARIDGAVIRVWGKADGLPSDYVMSMQELRDGRMLFGTTEGFAEWSASGIRSFSSREIFPAGEVFSFLEQDDGVVWLGTDSGLLRWENERFRSYGRAEGLPQNAVFSINEDRRGQLYLSTNAGLVRIRRADLDASDPLKFDLYTREDGLAGTQINGSSQPSSWRSRNGQLWLPTARGVSVLDLGRRPERSRGVVPVAIETVRVDGEQQSLDAVQVPPGKRRIRMEFAGLSYQKTNKLLYRYRLIGFDTEWSPPQSESSVEFTNLRPGAYRLEVQAGQDGFEGSPTATLAFDVRPRFWQNLWFLPLVGMVLLLLGCALHLLRLRAVHSRSRKLELQVEERTAELTARNEALERADKDKSALLSTIQLQAQAFARQAREDELTGLSNRRHFDQLLAREFARQQASGKQPIVGLVDIDLFKSINDRWSHQAGDDVLRAVAAVLERQLQGIGAPGRYGGEEFALYFSGVDLERAKVVAEAIRAEIAALRFSSYPGLQTTVSIGLSASQEALNHEKLLADADRQLYAAKAQGRNRVVG